MTCLKDRDLFHEQNSNSNKKECKRKSHCVLKVCVCVCISEVTTQVLKLKKRVIKMELSSHIS